MEIEWNLLDVQKGKPQVLDIQLIKSVLPKC